MKRAAVALLWAFAFWYLGSTLALFLGISGPLGAVLGIAAGSIALIDPLQVMWVPKAYRGHGSLSENVAANS